MLTRLIPSADAHSLTFFQDLRIILGLVSLSYFPVMLFTDMSACALVTFKVTSQHLEFQLCFGIGLSETRNVPNDSEALFLHLMELRSFLCSCN